jgi:pantothenate kinase type III
VATGSFSNLIGRACQQIDEVDELLSLRGLSLLWQRNAR